MAEQDDRSNGGANNSQDEKPEPDPVPIWHIGFALISALAALVLAGVFIWVSRVLNAEVGLGEAWTVLDPAARLAARVMMPLTGLGIVLVMVGAWMATVEWRGHFTDLNKLEKQLEAINQEIEELKKKHDEMPLLRRLAVKARLAPPAADKLEGIIGAVGKLRGAALVMVTGALLMLAAAWIAQSAAAPPPAVPGQTPAAQPTPP